MFPKGYGWQARQFRIPGILFHSRTITRSSRIQRENEADIESQRCDNFNQLSSSHLEST